ncbi:DUF3791 domain-containing protein [Ruminococcus sp. HUN007]|uniref:DUF3791 domain-containing protein n=1 Tax=Ruminococcus sp. HUN007 TaxID=1514668 RepID=UPI0005D21E1A|nr:DUF3791 domain-containing protein [Ruminococcus sp. HUN007]
MSREGEFLVYCMERYRYYRHLTGKEVSELFKKSGANNYILKCFGALHTVGEEYLINDLDEYIAHTIRANNL